MNVHQLSPTHWRVDSESCPGKQYDVERRGHFWTCNCRSCQRGGRRCKHIARVADCPTCKGRGTIKLSLLWYEADGSRSLNELACIECQGSGRRTQPAALPSQEVLKRSFS